MWYWLLLILPKINYANDWQCENISCDHDNVSVCGVHNSESKEVSFRLFQDQCAWRKFECENGMKGFTPISMAFCNQALSFDTRRDGASVRNIAFTEEIQTGDPDVPAFNTYTTIDLIDTTIISEERTCIECDCNSKADTICAIRVDGERFIIRWFADKCHMLQYNCENSVNFTETDDYICVGDKSFATDNRTIEPNDISKGTENIEKLTTHEPDVENKTCIQHECISNNIVICAIRSEGERFLIRWFNDTCHMLQYNCEKQVNFSVIDDFICAGDNNFTEKYSSDEELLTTYDDVLAEVQNITDLLEPAEQTAHSEITDLSKDNRNKLKENEENALPNKVVVSTFDLNNSINQTVDDFFAESHSTGIQIQKLKDEETRRMIVKYTGPVNIFVPRAFVPANYTPAENRNQSKKYPEYSPLVKYCYHKCPQKCPEFYKPVCGARIDNKKYTPFVIFRNHCYMDIAKCQMYWADFKGRNYTDIEEMGFIFCGGYQTMNMVYMYPLIRILQKMGRLQKKGKVHFVMRNLGYFPIRLQG